MKRKAYLFLFIFFSLSLSLFSEAFEDQDPRDPTERILFEDAKLRVSFLLNHEHIQDGLYLIEKGEARRKGDRGGKPRLLLKGTLEDFNAETEIISSSNEMTVKVEEPGGITKSRGLVFRTFIFQMNEASSASTNFKKVYILRLAHTPGGGDSRLLDFTDIRSALTPLFPWSYSEGSFRWDESQKTLLFSVNQHAGREERALTAAAYFDISNFNIYEDPLVLSEIIFRGVYMEPMTLERSLVTLPNGHQALIHPEDMEKLALFDSPFARVPEELTDGQKE